MKATVLSSHNNIFTRSSKSDQDKRGALIKIKDSQPVEFFEQLNQFINLGHDKRYSGSLGDGLISSIATLGENSGFNQAVTRSLATAIIVQVVKLDQALPSSKISQKDPQANLKNGK